MNRTWAKPEKEIETIVSSIFAAVRATDALTAPG
jgi:hypothetical protein